MYRYQTVILYLCLSFSLLCLCGWAVRLPPSHDAIVHIIERLHIEMEKWCVGHARWGGRGVCVCARACVCVWGLRSFIGLRLLGGVRLCLLGSKFWSRFIALNIQLGSFAVACVINFLSDLLSAPETVNILIALLERTRLMMERHVPIFCMSVLS